MNPTAQLILHDIFVLGVTAASIFVKNPVSQERAGLIISILQKLVPELNEAPAPEAPPAASPAVSHVEAPAAPFSVPE